MKKTLFILLLFSFANLFAQTTYYVKNSGSDALDGKSEANAWQTISKVNAFWAAGSFAPGDSILLNTGDTWHEKIVVSESGTSGNPIVISSFGGAPDPIITGFSTIGMWTQLNDSIDYVVIETANNPTFVAVDGIWQAMGRYPNTGYMTITANPATGKIVSTGLGNSPNWTGAEAVIRVRNWITDRCAITSHNTDTINYTRRSALNPVVGWGFFIQNSLSALDTQFEWYYNGDTLFMHNGGESLGLYTIQVPTIDTLLYGAGYDRIHVDGIKFTGSGRNAIHTFNFADYWEIKNCEFDLNGENAIYFQNQQRYTTVDNNTINRSVRAGIYMASSGNNTVTNNNIKNSGMLLGGSNSGTQNNGIFSSDHVYGLNNLFQYNEIDSSGYNGIYFEGNNSQVKNNYIKNSVLLLNDGGGIYTQRLTSVRRLIEGNIVLSSYGNFDGTVPVIDWTSKDTMHYGEGIYLDAGGTTAGVDGSYDVRVINNTVAHNGQNGICIHEAYHDTIIGNISYDNRNAIKFQSFTSGVDSANYMYHNVMFARKYIDHFTFRGNDQAINSLDADSNYFLRPVSDFENIALWIDGGWTPKDLTYWQSTYGLDANSTGSTEAAIDEDQFIFRYNPTKEDSTFTISENVVTIDGNAFTGDTVISAYSSAVFTIQQSTDVPAIVSDSIDIATRKHVFIFSNITGDGGSAVTGRGVAYSSVGIPTVDSTKVTSGTGPGAFGTRIDNLLKETTYFFRPYATNANGTKYGDMWNVTTPEYNYLINKAGKLLTDKSGKLIKYDPEVTADPISSFDSLMADAGTLAEFVYTDEVTIENDSISNWGNQRGELDLSQATTAKRPILTANGILFDGALTSEVGDVLASTIGESQPIQIYLYMKQVTWTASGRFVFGGAGTVMQQRTSTPNVRIGDYTNAVFQSNNSNLAVDTWATVSVFFSGANSILQINDTAETTGNAGSSALSNFAIGSYLSTTTGTNIEVKHIVIRQSANFATDKEIIKAEFQRLYE